MGNEISKKYEMDEDPTASGGLACLWKIHSAKNKLSGDLVSVHVFKKEDLKDLDKAIREQVFDILRREIKVLSSISTRPHPGVVRLVETFEENRSVLAFVTERLTCSLANAIGDGPSALSPQIASAKRRRFETFEVSRGFFGLAEGLQYVHTIRRRLHMNLAPESIFLSPSGQWKLGGFGFSVDLPSNGSDSTPCPYFQSGARGGFDGPWRLHPVMAFSSPEATAPAGDSDLRCASDLFSLGCLIYQLFHEDPGRSRLITADATPQAHQVFCSTLEQPGAINVFSLPMDAQGLILSLVKRNPAHRMALGNVTINPIFHGTEVTVLKTIDSIPGRNPAEAATFLTSVKPAVAGFPLRVQRDCIMHPLLDACGSDESGRLLAFAMPIIMDVCDLLDRKEIISSVQEKFRPVLKVEPPESLKALVAALPLFLRKMNVNFFRSDVVPMVCRALQAEGSPATQESAVKAATDEAFHGAIDGKTREEDILPRVCWLVVRGSALSNRINALLCLAKTFHFYQVRAVVEKVLPTLKFAAERDQTVAIQLCVLGCYEAISKRLEKLDPIAMHILPACTPMLTCKGLNSKQFEMVVGKVEGMLEAVIASRRREIANPKASSSGVQSLTPSASGDGGQHAAASLGSWKPAPAAPPSPIPATKPFAGAGGTQSTSPPATVSASKLAGIDIADLLMSAPATAPASGGRVVMPPSQDTLGATSASSPSSPFAAVPPLRTHQDAQSFNPKLPYGSDSGGLPNHGASSALSMFDGLSIAQENGNNDMPSSNTSRDPFAAAGLSDSMGHLSRGKNHGGGGSRRADLPNSESTQHTIPSATSASTGSTSPLGAPLISASTASSVLAKNSNPGMGLSSLAPRSPVHQSRPRAVGASDPFSAFFDAATTGGSSAPARIGTTPSYQDQSASPPVGTSVPFQNMGGMQATGMQHLGGRRLPQNTAGDSSLEDQLATTQREIAQLTQQLGSSGQGPVFGGNANVALATTPGLPQASQGGTGFAFRPPGDRAQGATSNADPFAFLKPAAPGAKSAGGQMGVGNNNISNAFDGFC